MVTLFAHHKLLKTTVQGTNVIWREAVYACTIYYLQNWKNGLLEFYIVFRFSCQSQRKNLKDLDVPI